MWFKHRAWIPVAWLLSFGNLVALWFAAQLGEALHATVHGGLAVAFALGARRLMARPRADALNRPWQQTSDQNQQVGPAIHALQARLQELEERVDFVERLLTQLRDSDRLPPVA